MRTTLLASLVFFASCNSSDKTPTGDSTGAGAQSDAASGAAMGKQATVIEFKEGDAVDVLYAGSYYPATIVRYDKDNNCYEVKYDNPASPNACKELDRLRPRGKSYAEPFSNNPEDAYGTWNTSTVTETTSETSTHVTTERSGYAHGTITINPDHTWQWNPTSTEKLSGSWDLNPSPSQYRGPIHIIKGLSGSDWYVGYYGKDDQGKPSIYISNDMGQRWFGGR